MDNNQNEKVSDNSQENNNETLNNPGSFEGQNNVIQLEQEYSLNANYNNDSDFGDEVEPVNNPEQQIQFQEQYQHEQEADDQSMNIFLNIAPLVEAMGNDVYNQKNLNFYKAFLQQGTLDAIADFLGISQQSQFDDIIVDSKVCLARIDEIMIEKKKNLEVAVYNVMKSYDKLNLQSNLNVLEKIMKILKSKHKKIYITKDIQRNTECYCSEHQEDANSKQQAQDENTLTQNQFSSASNGVSQFQKFYSYLSNSNNQAAENNQEVQTSETENVKSDPTNEERPLVVLNQEGSEQQTEQVPKFECDCESNKNNNDAEPEQMLSVQVEKSGSQNLQIEKVEQIIEDKQVLQSVYDGEEKMQNQQEEKEEKIPQQQENNQKEENIQEHQENNPVGDPNTQEQPQGGHLHNNQQTPIINCNDLFGIMSLKSLNLSQLENYNPDENSLVFRLHKAYKIEITGGQQEVKRFINKDSYFSPLPVIISTHYIFPYFSALELFKLRIVCGEWKDLVKQAWHIIFKREMYEQLLAKDIQSDIFAYTKLVLIRTPFYQKVGLLLKAMIEVIDWQLLLIKLETKTLEDSVKKVLVCILKLLGDDIPIDYVQNFDETIWDMNKEKIQNLKTSLDDIFSPQFSFPSKNNLLSIKDRFLMNSDLNLHHMFSLEDKNGIYLTICANQLYFFALLKTQLYIQQIYIARMHAELQMLTQRQSPNKKFLEGAYKMLLLKTSTIRNGEVVSNLGDDEQQSSDEENQDDNQTDNSQAAQFIKSLTNINPNQSINTEPDIVIKKNKISTSIYIDIFTKFDIIVSSMNQFQLLKKLQSEENGQSTQLQQEGVEQNPDLVEVSEQQTIVEQENSHEQANNTEETSQMTDKVNNETQLMDQLNQPKTSEQNDCFQQ